MIDRRLARLGAPAAAAALALLSSASLRAEPLPDARSPEAVGFSSARLRTMDAAFDKLVADGEVAGVSTLLVRHGKVVAFRAHGVSSLATQAPLRRDAIFRIYSMSKPVTGVAMMILFERGKWRLDDPIEKYLPEMKDLKVQVGVAPDGKPILEAPRHKPTMRELMSHTAGFSYGSGTTPADKMYAERKVTESQGLDQFVQRVSGIPLLYQPGAAWVYSVSVDLQGAIVERLSGKPFGQFLHDEIFTPLRMVDTGFVVPAEKMGRLPAAYSTDPATGKLVDAAARDRDYTRPPPYESGGGGLLSTIDDYGRFAAMLANDGELDGVRILSPAAVELMRTNAIGPDVRAAFGPVFSDAMGFGLDFQLVLDPRKLGKMEGRNTMSWEGAAGTIFWVDPTNDVVFVGMLQNYTRAGPNNSIDAMTRPLVYQALVDPSK